MKKIILIGNVACGKTTICQYLNHMEIKYKKTQALEVYNTTIDTPGEYLENRGYLRSLMVTATETDQVVFVQDASRDQFFFSPGQSSAFTLPVAGVVTKITSVGWCGPDFQSQPDDRRRHGRTGGFSGGERGCSGSMIKKKIMQ